MIPAKQQKIDDKERASSKRKYTAVIGITIIVIIIAGALVYGLESTKPTDISTFKSNFNSAQRVAIYAKGNNGTQWSSAIGCATAIIESIVGNPTYHRNASAIDFFVLNRTACTYEYGVSGTVSNYTYNSISNCLSISAHEPSIFVNYSTANSTHITPTALYVSGNQQYLGLCGVASEIT